MESDFTFMRRHNHQYHISICTFLHLAQMLLTQFKIFIETNKLKKNSAGWNAAL